MGLENPLHLGILFLIILLLFGARRLPELGRSLGEGMRGFKDTISGDDSKKSALPSAPVAADAPPTEPAAPPPTEPAAPPPTEPAAPPPAAAQPVAAPAPPVASPPPPAAPASEHQAPSPASPGGSPEHS